MNAYYNGTFCNRSEVKIPITDRAVFFGDGVYDAAAGRYGKIYLEDEHLKRFMTNSANLNIRLKFTRREISDILHTLIEESGYQEYFIYFQATRYSKERTHSYGDFGKSNFLAIIKEHKMPDTNAHMKLLSQNDIRYSMCNIKTLNLLPNVIASQRAEMSGYDEAVFIRDGIVTECAHSNVSIVKNGIVITHPNDETVLPGITKKRMLQKCCELEIPYKEAFFKKEDLYAADEILVTSTTKLCLRAKKIDNVTKKMSGNTIGEKLVLSLKEDFLISTQK